MPQFSIIIPTFNRSTLISKTLESVLAQSFDDWECLVVDDFSTDNTKEVVENYCEKDSRLRYLTNQRKKGAQGARNTGILHAQTEWIGFFDSDNIMHPDLLESMFCAMREDNTQSDVYTCFSNVIDYKTQDIVGSFKWVCEGDISKEILTGECYVDYNCAFIRKKKLLEIGGLDENCPSMQEWDTHIRLSSISTYHTILRVLIDYYIGGSDAISSDKNREIIGRLYILKKYKKKWVKLKDSHINYVKSIHTLIKQHPNSFFRIKYSIKLVIAAPSVQWTIIKRHIKHTIHLFQ